MCQKKPSFDSNVDIGQDLGDEKKGEAEEEVNSENEEEKEENEEEKEENEEEKEENEAPPTARPPNPDESETLEYMPDHATGLMETPTKEFLKKWKIVDEIDGHPVLVLRDPVTSGQEEVQNPSTNEAIPTQEAAETQEDEEDAEIETVQTGKEAVQTPKEAAQTAKEAAVQTPKEAAEIETQEAVEAVQAPKQAAEIETQEAVEAVQAPKEAAEIETQEAVQTPKEAAETQAVQTPKEEVAETTVLLDSDENMEGGAFQDATGNPTVKGQKYMNKANEEKCDRIMAETKNSNKEDILAAQKKMRQTLREGEADDEVEDEDRELMAAEEESEEKQREAVDVGVGADVVEGGKKIRSRRMRRRPMKKNHRSEEKIMPKMRALTNKQALQRRKERIVK